MQQQKGQFSQKGCLINRFSLVLQKRLHILELPQTILLEHLCHLSELNPFLEIKLHDISENSFFYDEENHYPKDGFISKESFITQADCNASLLPYTPSLFEELLPKVRELLPSFEDKKIAEYLVGNLEASGYLLLKQEELSSIANLKIDKVNILLTNIKEKIDPPGLFASCPQEALLLQLKRIKKEKTLAYQIVSNYYPDLLKKNFSFLSKTLCCSVKDIRTAIRNDLAPLHIPPLSDRNEQQQLTLIKPDILIEKDNKNQWVYKLFEDEFFSLNLQKNALQALTSCTSKKEKSFYRHYIKEGIELIYSWETRKDLLRQIAKQIIDSFASFLEAKEPLSPLSIRHLASYLQVHYSTACRAIKDKYVECPLGILPLNLFFSQSKVSKNHRNVSAKELLFAILTLVKKEDLASPLSDQDLLRKLQENGFACSRRTVSKYRKKLLIPSSFHRRKT